MFGIPPTPRNSRKQPPCFAEVSPQRSCPNASSAAWRRRASRRGWRCRPRRRGCRRRCCRPLPWRPGHRRPCRKPWTWGWSPAQKRRKCLRNLDMSGWNSWNSWNSRLSDVSDASECVLKHLFGGVEHGRGLKWACASTSRCIKQDEGSKQDAGACMARWVHLHACLIYMQVHALAEVAIMLNHNLEIWTHLHTHTHISGNMMQCLHHIFIMLV